MKYTAFHGYRVSQLSLGTIQLGMDYGIANTKGAPNEAEAFRILDVARESGINTFDCARTYGRAEEVLGNYFANKPAGDLIVSKFKYDWEPGISVETAWQRTTTTIEQSLQALQVSQIPVCLYHKGPGEPMEEVMRIVPIMIERLKEKGYIRHAGLSLYYSADAHGLDDSPYFEALQIPMNVLDQALITEGLLEKLHGAGKLIFIRSVFLQGLFFQSPGALNETLKPAIPFLEKIKTLADEHGMTVAQLAFGFIRDLPHVDSLVIGAENQEQIRTNLDLLRGPRLPDPLRDTLSNLSKHVPRQVITPGLWGK
ncbi:aldo/keto reductase [Ravibacter arvi]|uniref:Aldo/keto reductase n=1 Tax=Ravibacter arvi TaxID=2051041 RepID=A0ABP8M869_9BACT